MVPNFIDFVNLLIISLNRYILYGDDCMNMGILFSFECRNFVQFYKIGWEKWINLSV